MADFIVLEEDGTSHLELEESSSDILLEDGGLTLTKTGFGKVGTVGSGVGPPAPPPSNATWKVGTVTVPSSTGTVSVTGLGGTPAAVFFWGTNWTTEDVAVSTAHLGMFRGMAAPHYTSGSIINSASCVIPAGDAHHTAGAPNNFCINMLEATGNLAFLYTGRVTSLDVDGFSLQWTLGASGGYKVVYAALMDVQNVGGFLGMYNNTLTLGWKAGAAMLHGAFNGPDVGDGNATQEFYGSAAYPGTSNAGWKGAGITAFWRPELGGQGRLDIEADDPTNLITQGGHITGAFLIPSNIQAHPVLASLNQFNFGGDASDGGMLVAWDDEDNMTGFFGTPDNATDTATLTGLPFAPGMVTAYTISDEPVGGTTFLHGAIGFSVVTPDFQWCAIADGAGSQGSYQSFSNGWADNVSGTSVHAGTMELTADGFILTTVDDALNSSGQWVYHAFGHPEQIAVWIPQSYRRRNKP